MRTLQSTLATAVLGAAAVGAAHASIFIAAHPDDVQHLMGRNAANDVINGYPTVIVLLTAGDAGKGAAIAENRKAIPYYRARLNAHEATIQFWQSFTPGASPAAKAYNAVPGVVRSTEVLASQNVEKISMGNVTLYNFNLPDGRLSDLEQYRVGSLASVTGSSTFTLAALRQALRDIIKRTHAGVPTINANYQDYDSAGDHPDHAATGRIVYWALNDPQFPGYTCIYQNLYQGYNAGNYGDTMNAYDRTLHAATLGVLNGALVANGNASTWDAFHINFIGKMVFRQVGGGVCGL